MVEPFLAGPWDCSSISLPLPGFLALAFSSCSPGSGPLSPCLAHLAPG